MKNTSRSVLLIIGVLFLFSSNTTAQSSQPLQVLKTLKFNLSKDRIWSALTDENELGVWWNKGVRLEPRVGGDFYEPWGKDQLATGKVIAVKPAELIEFTWREKTWKPSEKTVCRFSISRNQDKTILEVKHSGWEVFPKKDRLKLVNGFDKGWDFFLSKLEKYLENDNRTSN